MNELLDKKAKINEIYKIKYNNNSFDTQWKNKDKFFSKEKVKALFHELNLPYDINSRSCKGVRRTIVTKNSNNENKEI